LFHPSSPSPPTHRSNHTDASNRYSTIRCVLVDRPHLRVLRRRESVPQSTSGPRQSSRSHRHS
jgi:hypothetical protein